MANEMREPAAPPPYPPERPRPRRLTRSNRERMWAGVAGGMAEYFDLDPALVRLLWVAAAVVTGGLAIPVYILAWIILPPEDARMSGGAPDQWRAPEPPPSAAPDAGIPTTSAGRESDAWWRSERYTHYPRQYGHHRSTGILLVALGVLLLAANAGIFSWIEWRMLWPLIFIGLGVLLLARQTGWR